jgi:hypothetical protein
MDYTVIKEVSLKADASTGKTKHFKGSEELTTPTKLQIAQYPDDSGFYLFYLNQNDEILTDTYHETFESAVAQAEFEFNVPRSDWTDR